MHFICSWTFVSSILQCSGNYFCTEYKNNSCNHLCLDILHGCDIDQGQFLDICFSPGWLLSALGGVHGGQDVNACLDGCPADEESVSGCSTPWDGVSMTRSILWPRIRSRRFGDSCSILLVRIAFTPASCSTFAVLLCCIDTVSELLESSGDLDSFFFVCIFRCMIIFLYASAV